MSHSQPADSALDVEPLLVDLLERIARGEQGALDELCRAHPALEAELRERVRALEQMNLLPTDAAANAFPERLGAFRLVRRLGGGGMGVVYEAFDEQAGRAVALKLIRPEHLYFPRAKERFRRESQAVSRLSHPGVVALHSVGEAGDSPYLAMELIDGATAQQALEQFHGVTPENLTGRDLRAAAMARSRAPIDGDDGALPELFTGSWVDACVRLALRVAGALVHAHERGILHRDIKPSNIAITPAGRAVLLDFGLAGLANEGRMTITGATLGSMLYMAPEQVAGRAEEIDERTDVYSLGVTLYELLALQPPYVGADAELTRAAILEGQPSSIRARNREVSRELELVCFKAIERDRARRYGSMLEFERDLEAVAQGRPVSARAPGVAYRTWRWVKRNPTRSTALAGVAALALAGPLGLYLGELRQKQELERALAAESAARTQASEERQRADERAREAEATSTYLVRLFGGADPYLTGRRDLRASELLATGVQRIDLELSGQPRLQAQLLERIGESYTNLERFAEAVAPLERALRLREQLDGDQAQSTAGARLLLASALRLARRPGYVPLLRQAVDVLERDPALRTVCLRAGALLALSLLDEQEYDQAAARVDALAAGLENSEDLPRALRWNVMTMFASAQLRLGRYSDAEAAARTALAFDENADSEVQPHAFRAAALDTLGSALRHQERVEEALAVYDELTPLSDKLYGRDNPVSASHRTNYARTLDAAGRTEEALEQCRRVLESVAPKLGMNSAPATATLRTMALVLSGAGRYEEALSTLSDAREQMLAQGGEADPNAALALVSMAETHLARGDAARAAALAREAAETLSAADAPRAWGLVAYATWRAGGSADEAQAAARRALQGPLASSQFEARLALASCALARGERAEALRMLAELERDARGPDALRWSCQLALATLGRLELEDGNDRGCERLRSALAQLSRSLHASHAELRAAIASVRPLGERCAGLAELLERAQTR